MDKNKRYFKNCSCLNSNDFIYGTNDFKKLLKCFMKNLIKQGMSCQEFKDRGMKHNYMCDLFTGLFFMNLKQWKSCGQKKKNRKQEQHMDAFIEKSMVFFFDSLAPNLFDTFLDMMKHSRSK
jgi:hypothetical protein